MKGLGTGTLVWPAAVVLSKYLEKHFGSGEMQGKRVCDIGSGTGCTGFVTASLGATTVLTDQSCIMFLLEENRVLNCVENTVADPQLIQLKKYEWGRNDMDDELDFDYILVSDCVLPKLYPIEELVKVR